MRLIGLLMLISGLALAQPKAAPPKLWTQEPDSFVGVPFNSSKAEVTAMLASRQQKFDICGKSSRGGIFCSGSLLKIGDMNLELILTFSTDDKLGEVVAGFPSGEFETVKDVFIQRYGEPQVLEDSTVQTGAGAKYANQTLQWKGKVLDITLLRYADKVTQGLFGITLHSLSDADEKAKEEAKKKAAGTL